MKRLLATTALLALTLSLSSSLASVLGTGTPAAAAKPPPPAVSTPAFVQASPEALTRRLWLDLYERPPLPDEFYAATKRIGTKGGYEALVDDMLQSPEYRAVLARQIVEHYAPLQRDQPAPLYLLLRQHIAEHHLQKDNDLRQFLLAMLGAQGSAWSNPMVLFFNLDEKPEEMTGRFCERIIGVPIGCAQCHDHKIHPDISSKDFWSVAAIFTATERQVLSTRTQLEKLVRTADNSYDWRETLGKSEITALKTWLAAEKKGQSPITDPVMTILLSGHSAAMAKPSQALTDDSLSQPFLFIHERERKMSSLRINYEIDGKPQHIGARLPFQEGHKAEQGSPRLILAQYLAYKKPQFMARNTVNWISKWLLGRSFIATTNDIYGELGAPGKILDQYAQTFIQSQFNIHSLTGAILKSEYYRRQSATQDDDEAFAAFRERRYRHLNGHQLIKILRQDDLPVIENQDLDARLAYLQSELDHDAFAHELFPRELADTDAHYQGNLVQALAFANDEKLAAHIHRIARLAHTQASQPPGLDKALDTLFIRFYTRLPTASERFFFAQRLKPAAPYENSGFFPLVWTLVNGPEMRLY